MSSLLRWLLIGEWRVHPVRGLVALLAIALGVALGYGIHLVNAAAFDEFSAAARTLSGSADLQLKARATSFDEALYPTLVELPEVTLAAPVLELDVAVAGQRGLLKLIGIDAFQSAGIAPDLVGIAADDTPHLSLMADSVFLSPAAIEWLQIKLGDTLLVKNGTQIVSLKLAGTLTRARAGQRLAVMDIGSAQWQFGRVGQLSRIDLRLNSGVNRAALMARLEAAYGSTLVVSVTEDQDQRSATLSRAYRVNLSVLAMVALFTGAFLVFSTQALSVLRRRPQFALLRTLGATPRQLLLQVLIEGGLLGLLGSALGLLMGWGLAGATLSLFGGDLGGGYFPGVQPRLNFDPVASALFFGAGIAVAVLGSLAPALEAARARPAAALKAGSADHALDAWSKPWLALGALILGAGLTRLPPVADLPVFAYFAILLLLIGSIALMPWAAATLFNWLAPRWQGVSVQLSMARLANAPNQASIALGGVLASFSLMVAMAIMVMSFRVSVDDWLQQLLSADFYVRVDLGGDAAKLNLREQQAIAELPAVARSERTRWLPLTLEASRPNVMLIARSMNEGDTERALPLIGASLKQVAQPIWISEAMVDLYGWQLGQSVTLPMAGQAQTFTVAGIWRDYARQAGAIQMRLSDYQRLTHDTEINDLALWLKRDSSLPMLRQQLQELSFASALEFVEPSEIRAISLRLFDRSFAITYLLEGVAIVIGLFGVAATFSAQTLSRAREFGMLRHIGMTRRQILNLLTGEGLLLAALAIVAGFMLGWCISLILVFIVNPQSFHWTMQLHMPWTLLSSVALLLLVSAALTARISGRLAVAGSAVRAVREDW